MTGWKTLPRPFGEYLLVAPLGDDALGTVYRALHSADERRFMRLRILQSGELSPAAIAAAVGRQAERSAPAVHDGIVRRAQFGLVNGVPYMAWYETAGWTLDRVLGRVRALNSRITVEYALLLAQRIVAAMERASPTVAGGTRSHHGLLWPGFVSVSNDAEVRVGGFGLAEAVFPLLQKPRLYRDIAPYVAPEARERRTIAANSDVYSLGVILLELLTGRRPAVSTSVPDLRAGDPLSTEIAAVLERSLAPVARRYGSVVEMHESMEQLLASSSPAPSPADLALFLYRLLNPESHGIASADGDSTNPVFVEPDWADEARFPAPGPLTALTDSLAPAVPESPAPPEGDPSSDPEHPGRLIEEPPSPPAADGEPRRANGGSLLLIAGILLGLAILIDNKRERPTEGIRRAVAAARRAGPTPRRERAGPSVHERVGPSVPRPMPTRPASPTDPAPLPAALGPPAIASAPVVRSASVTPRVRPAPPKPGPREETVERKPAEDSRFQAAMARIAADRLEARELAPEAFQEASDRETAAGQLLSEGRFGEARTEFDRAAGLFRQARDLCREERARRIKTSLVAEPPGG